MTLRIFSRRDGRMQQISRRLAEIESTYDSLREADPAQTHERLLRLRYGTSSAAEETDGS